MPRGRDGAVQVHLPGDPPAELDGLKAAAEGLGEDALDETLEPALELLESHGWRNSIEPGRLDHGDAAGSAPRPARRTGVARLPCHFHSGEWRNWQTRRIQVPVSERMWGFKSPLAHRLDLGFRG